MTSFTNKDVKGLKQCPLCHKYTNIMRETKYYCWNCNTEFKEVNNNEK